MSEAYTRDTGGAHGQGLGKVRGDKLTEECVRKQLHREVPCSESDG